VTTTGAKITAPTRRRRNERAQDFLNGGCRSADWLPALPIQDKPRFPVAADLMIDSAATLSL